MNAARWHRIETLFAELTTLPPQDRAARLQTLEPDDEEMRHDVASLLECDFPEQSLQRVVRLASASTFQVQATEGERLGSYRVIRKLGQGGMGTVFLAVRADDQYRQQVAIKLLSLGMETAESVERFRRERQILASLEHPYVARLLDGGSAAMAGLPHETPYFVMEFVEGEPVNEYCQRRQMDVNARVRLFLKICEAVTYAHRKLIVHRDLKPGNILVTPEGSPKLLDFGIAKLLSDDGLGSLQTIAGLGMTPDFASPEQVLEEPITTAADVYSLGAILYLLLTGAKPHRFLNYSAREIRHVICETEAPKLTDVESETRTQLRGDLEAIVSMAMRREPERRYSSVEQLSADLGRYLNGWPVIARADRFNYRAGKYLRRNRTAIAAGVVMALALAGGAAAATFEARQASRAQLHAEHDRELAVASQARAEANQREAVQQAEQARALRELADAQRHEAEFQKAVADRRFDQVHQLAGKFLMDFHTQISRLPGSTPARKMVIETGLRYYDTLVKEAGNNRQLLEEIADGYDRLGDVQGNPAFANLGDREGALASFGKALSIREKISDPSPAFWESQISNRVKMSQVSASQLDFKSTERYLRVALSLVEQSPAASSLEVQGALGRVYGGLGDLKSAMGLHSESIDPYQKQLDMAIKLAPLRIDPVDAEARISMGHTKLGEALGNVKRMRESLDHLRLALEIDQRLADSNPTNNLLGRKVFISYYTIGRMLSSPTGREFAQPGELQTCIEQAAKVADKMSSADPENLGALADLLIAMSAQGEWLRSEKRTAEALVPLTRAVATAEHIKDISGQDTGNQDSLILAHRRLATALTQAARYDEAFQHFTKAENYLAYTESKHPGLVRNASRNTGILEGKAEWYAAQSRWAEAATAFQKEIALYDWLSEHDAKNDSALADQPHYYIRLAECYRALSQKEAAARAIGTALDRYEALESRRPLLKAEAAERESARTKLAAWSER